ncbi:MAG: biosynthetic-type acetolactate synthase large subunit [Hyphomonadaceae bacterium]|nr:biosynthetic-type acetolactate synthase large subunit [Clostridia bacterium]
MFITGAEIFVECLKEQGVDTIFGFPGGQAIVLYDALGKHQHEIRHILTAHEQGASHAADGYARATGKVGVCLATSGPGATNLVTGIATAYMDSIPMVAFTGQVPTTLLGRDSFQEVDITGITMPITKHNFIVKDVKELAPTIRRAFAIAREGRPGPVLVDICKDASTTLCEYTPEAPTVHVRKLPTIKREALDHAVELLANAKKPVIIAGGGVILSDASETLFKLVEKRSIPITNTIMGLGSFPGTHTLFMGMIGMHGSKTSNMAITHSDLIINIGARFSDRVVGDMSKFGQNAKVIHIDIDPAEIGKNITAYLPLVGDMNEVLSYILEHVPQSKNDEWLAQIAAWKEQYPLARAKSQALQPYFIIEKINEVTKGDAIIATEVGQHQMWTAQYFKFLTPRSFVTSGGLGTMGFGFGAAMGAKLGMPHKTVFNIAGDGSFRMNCNELGTAVEYQIPIIIVIFNNHVLGMVRQWQTLFFDSRYSNTNIDRGTDFVKLAEAFGATGFNVTKPEQLEDILKQAIAINGPVVINCEIDRDEKVFPIVPPGAAISDSILE